MTRVTFELSEPGSHGDVPARGYLLFEPTKSRTSGTNEVLPLPFMAQLVNGFVEVDLAPTGQGWSWGVTYRLLGIVHYEKNYLVPQSGLTVPHTSLVSVDPDSLEPEGTPDLGWYAYVDALVESQVGVVHVVTGEETRLPTGTVFWVGGQTQPVNMAENTDIWFRPAQ